MWIWLYYCVIELIVIILKLTYMFSIVVHSFLTTVLQTIGSNPAGIFICFYSYTFLWSVFNIIIDYDKKRILAIIMFIQVHVLSSSVHCQLKMILIYIYTCMVNHINNIFFLVTSCSLICNNFWIRLKWGM